MILQKRYISLNENEPRVETGPLQFGNDKLGLFIRGDAASYYAIALEEMLLWLNKLSPNTFHSMQLLDLVDLFRSANERERIKMFMDRELGKKE